MLPAVILTTQVWIIVTRGRPYPGTQLVGISLVVLMALSLWFAGIVLFRWGHKLDGYIDNG